ncbi:MAG: hypothetical protein EOL97_12875 [Spirochaetia bacterium]|nr:hypothetical protein [Spirochaetia bacterium]
MVKVKDIKKSNNTKRSKITVKSLADKVRIKLNEKQVEKVMKLLESKYSQLQEAQKIVDKIEKQIKTIEDKDINELDLDDYKY